VVDTKKLKNLLLHWQMIQTTKHLGKKLE